MVVGDEHDPGEGQRAEWVVFADLKNPSLAAARTQFYGSSTVDLELQYCTVARAAIDKTFGL